MASGEAPPRAALAVTEPCREAQGEEAAKFSSRAAEKMPKS